MQKSIQHEKKKFIPKGVIQACFTTISLTYHLFWKKKKEKKISIKLKNTIYIYIQHNVQTKKNQIKI